jgi:polysaccharide export outer membrane protein
MFQHRHTFCLFIIVAILGGCSAYSQSGPVNPELASYAAPSPTRGAGSPYRLGPGDKLRIKAYDDVNLTGEYEVNNSGFISFPLVGQVKAAGSTTSQLEQTLAARMKGKIAQDPKINIELATYASFYIHGEVKKAGVYPYQPGLTVADAIATAGGLTYRANENTIYLQHAGARAQQIVSLDEPVRIYPGDNIRVSERMF